MLPIHYRMKLKDKGGINPASYAMVAGLIPPYARSAY